MALWISALCALSCVGGGLAPSIWPPSDFSLVVEESRGDGDAVQVVRQLYVQASGVVIYGTSSRPLIDEEAGVSLPVLERMSIYQLEPASVRSLARKLNRAGIGAPVSPAATNSDSVVLSILWRGFAERSALVSSGRPRGSIGEVIALVAGHLPAGESFDTKMTRPVVSVLSGAPAPKDDAFGAYAALRTQLEVSPEDPVLLLDAFALACRLGEGGAATALLERWQAAAQAEFEDSGADEDATDAPAKRAAAFRRLLPAAG